jgi:hypothetical protein
METQLRRGSVERVLGLLACLPDVGRGLTRFTFRLQALVVGRPTHSLLGLALGVFRGHDLARRAGRGSPVLRSVAVTAPHRVPSGVRVVTTHPGFGVRETARPADPACLPRQSHGRTGAWWLSRQARLRGRAACWLIRSTHPGADSRTGTGRSGSVRASRKVQFRWRWSVSFHIPALDVSERGAGQIGDIVV